MLSRVFCVFDLVQNNRSQCNDETNSRKVPTFAKANPRDASVNRVLDQSLLSAVGPQQEK